MTGRYYKEYLKQYGYHFNEKLCKFAVSMMENDNGPITPITKQELDQKL